MSFQISPKIDNGKMFLVKRSELEGRLDSFFYIPDIVLIDNLVKSKSNLKLGDLILDMNGGATPKKTDKEKFYSDKHHGIPLLRVQNITEQGISTTNAIYINHDTHNGYLQRSQVLENDLLVTITGRIASSAVAQKRFIGNINQHSVVIKTKNKETSQYIAVFLNSHVGQKLALKRTTGGTRPALDYDALKSIPIIENLPIVAKMDAAYANKKQKETEAQWLLDSIDGYLLGELGIQLPEQEENTLQSRMFTRQLSEVSGGRFDPKLYANRTVSLKTSINGSTFPNYKLKQLIVESVAGDWGKELDSNLDGFEKCLVIRATEFDNSFNLNLDNTRLKHRLVSDKKLQKISVKENDLLIEKSGGSPDQPVGRTAIITKEVIGQSSHPIGYSNFVQKIRIDENCVSPSYLFCFLKTIHSIGLTDSMQSQTHGIRNLIMANYYNQSIPIPPLEKQTEIANHITKIRNQAKQLQQQAKAGLEQAKKEVEAMILSDDAIKE